MQEVDLRKEYIFVVLRQLSFYELKELLNSARAWEENEVSSAFDYLTLASNQILGQMFTVLREVKLEQKND